MLKDYDLIDILALTKKIKAKAEAMSADELEDLANGNGLLTFIDEEPDFAEWLETLPDDESMPIVDMIMSQVRQVWASKAETPHTTEEYLLLQKLDEIADTLTKEQLTKLLDIAQNPDIWLV